MQRSRLSIHPDRRGNATVIAVIVLFVIGSLAGVVLSVTQRHGAEVSALADQNRAFFVAQAAVNDVLARLDSGDIETPDEGDSLSIGSHYQPESVSGGRYWVDLTADGDEVFTLTAHARAGLQDKTVEVVVEEQVEGVFRNGIFAGNSSGDPTYVLELGGTGGQADEIVGDVYSGGSVNVKGDADVDGTIRAVQGVTGAGATPTEVGKKQAGPDLEGMNYEATADIKVASEFATGGATYLLDDAGGTAWQLPEANPAHIFRKNPSDRVTETLGTMKDDYFLEDPYETVRSDPNSNGADAYKITLSGLSGEPGVNSNGKVFFIDGNLWLHNYKTMSFKFAHKDPNGIQATFVVKGNIYFSDNFFYTNANKDGVAFIAMQDKAVQDSGNIYFGDPEFGTIERMYGYMYAENNFHDVNLSATGSTTVEVFGNMTAGNQVVMKRDYTLKSGKKTITNHTKLMVDFDERIADGELVLPGLPRSTDTGGGGFTVLSWREVKN